MGEFTSSNSFSIPEIEIPEEYFVTGAGGSSKGYSKKALYHGKWYKISAGTFNAQAEVVASRLARYSTLPNYIKYDICKINGEWGTVSDDFIKGRNHETIKGLHAKLLLSPIEDIENQLTGKDLYNYIIKFVKDSLGFDMTEGLNLTLRYDSVVLNEDRHFRNLEFVEVKPNVWGMIPPFDFDCSFFSQVEDWEEIKTYIHKSQPFFPTHKEQVAFLNTISDKRLVLKPFKPLSVVSNIWDADYQLGRTEILNYLETIREGLTV